MYCKLQIQILNPWISFAAILFVAYTYYWFIPDQLVIENQVELISITREIKDKVEKKISNYDKIITKFNELKAKENSWFGSLTEQQRKMMKILGDQLGIQDVSKVKEKITTVKIKNASILLNKTLSLRKKDLEDALLRGDIKAMRNLQKIIDKEQLVVYSLLPIEDILKSEMNVSSEMATTYWFDALFDLFKALAVSEDIRKRLIDIFLS